MINKTKIKQTKTYAGYNIIIIISIIVGFWFRFKGLWKWPLALDEYYIVKSAENILANGIPVWQNGGYYIRALIQQYFTAGLMIMGVKAEFAARLFPLILNMLTIPVLYFLAKKVSGKLLATTLLVLFCFSAWEIEFARFARMYAPFQGIFILYVYLLYSHLIENKPELKRWVLLTSFIAVLIHEAAIFIATLNFLILFWDYEKKKPDIKTMFGGKSRFKDLAIVIVILAVNLLTYFWDLRNISGGLYPPGYLETHTQFASGSTLNIPLLLINTAIQNKVLIFLFLPLLAFSMFIIHKIFRVSENSFFSKIILSVLILTSIFNLFGFLILLAALFLLINWINIDIYRRREFKYFVSAILLNLIFWFVYSFLTTSWYSFFPHFNTGSMIAIVKKILLLQFNYPDLYPQLYNYLMTIPFLTIIFIISFIIVFCEALFKNYQIRIKNRFVLFVVLILIVEIGFINTPLNETRYTFFLFPLVLIIILLNMEIFSNILFREKVKAVISFLFLVLIYLIVSEDFNVRHITQVDSKEINYRKVYTKYMEMHYYPRWDVKTPAEIVNKERKPGDVVIIDELNTEYYLDSLNYIYQHYDHARFIIISVEGGKKERWTNADLIYTNHDLLEVFKKTKGIVWFISLNKPYLEFENFSFKKNFAKYKYFTSYDGNVYIYRIPGGLKKY